MTQSTGKSRSPLTSLEKRLFLKWRERASGRQILLAVSGGLDSVCLAESLVTLSSRMNLRLVLATVHHGQMTEGRTEQMEFRAQAVEKMHEWAQERGLEFVTNSKLPTWDRAPSEQELRDFRHQTLRDLAVSQGCEWIALAHHQSDLFETRLINMIRGCGLQGLQGMEELSGPLWRPLLFESRQALLEYANEKDLQWMEDPSNENVEPLRNWLRQEWLPALEAKRPGSLATWMQSIQNLVEESVGKKPQLEKFLTVRGGLSRPDFLALNEVEKRGLLARYFLSIGCRSFGKSHIDEMIKRLDSPRKDLSFSLLKRNWTITPTEILAEG